MALIFFRVMENIFGHSLGMTDLMSMTLDMNSFSSHEFDCDDGFHPM